MAEMSLTGSGTAVMDDARVSVTLPTTADSGCSADMDDASLKACAKRARLAC